MLVLTRRIGERIRLRLSSGEDIWITVTQIQRRKAAIGITAPESIHIAREELIDRIDNEDASAGAAPSSC